MNAYLNTLNSLGNRSKEYRNYWNALNGRVNSLNTYLNTLNVQIAIWNTLNACLNSWKAYWNDHSQKQLERLLEHLERPWTSIQQERKWFESSYKQFETDNLKTMNIVHTSVEII